MSLSRFFEVTAADPEDARRRKLLNVLLIGCAILSLLIVALTAIADLLKLTGSRAEIDPIYVIGILLFLVAIGMYAVNRYLAGWVASLVFLTLVTCVLPFSDVPREVASGRTLFAFTLPIVISSVLLRPYAAFLFAAIGSLEITLLAISIGDVPNLPAILGFFMIALVSWLSARSLERTLKELILVNAELDRRVVERTQALSEALVRERAETGRIQAILEGIADGVVVFDNGGHAIAGNPAIQPLVGSPVQAFLGRSIEDWLAQADLPPAELEKTLALFRSSSIGSGNSKIQWGAKTLAISVAPVRISGGELIGRVAVFHDFTREAEIDRMKSDFLAMVSHELRTPLNSILGYTDMLREGIYGKLDSRQLGIVERMMANTHKLLVIVSDLLDQAQIETGRISFHNRKFYPVELIDYMRGVMDSIVQFKGLKLQSEISAGLPAMLDGDPQRLNQVLINLVNNAVKFTEQGSVQVRLFRVDADHWGMEVSDTGMGIPEDAQQVIFEPFRQVDMDVTRRPGGIGLGLSIVNRLVNLLHGEIHLDSQVGKGSTFTVILPLAAVEQPV